MRVPGAESAPTLTAIQPSSAGASEPLAALPPLSSARLPRLLVAGGDEGAALPEDGDLVALGVLGQGGMGRVLLGQQRSLGREVALKTLRPDRGSDAAALLREARITGSLEHPNIIPVHALGLDEQGRPVLVMKRVDGVSLGELLRMPDHEGWRWLKRATGAVDRREAAIEALVRTATALEFAHERGVIHRDVKPDNILIGRFGEVYLADWGVAVRQGEPAQPPIAGTPAYMAPEMTREVPLGPASDVYLLGATLHEILTGRHRHGGTTAAEVLASAARSEPPDLGPDVPRALAQLCVAATAADPDARPPSAAAFRKALLDHLRHSAAGRLTREALDRLGELRQRLAAGSGADEAEQQALHRALVECRFAFEMALREWPTSHEAADGLQAYLAEAARYELDRGNLEAAQALLREMREPAPALRQAADELERRRRSEQEQARAHEELARQHDTGAGAGMRAAMVGLLTIILLVVLLTLLLPRVLARQSTPTTADLLAPNAGILLLLSLTTAAARRRLLVNAVNRRFIALIFLTVSAMLVHRLLAFARGQLDIRPVLTDDLLLFCAILAIGTPTLGRGAPLVALAPLAGALLLSAGLPRPLLGFGASVAVTLGLLLAVNLRQRRRPRAS